MSKCEIDYFGNKRWFSIKTGRLHREDGPAVEHIDGRQEWYKDGSLHRVNGPAIIYPTQTEWHKNGRIHREDGPAIEYWNGYKEWYYYGKHVNCRSNKEFLKLIKLKAFW